MSSLERSAYVFYPCLMIQGIPVVIMKYDPAGIRSPYRKTICSQLPFFRKVIMEWLQMTHFSVGTIGSCHFLISGRVWRPIWPRLTIFPIIKVKGQRLLKQFLRSILFSSQKSKQNFAPFDSRMLHARIPLFLIKLP